MVLIQSQDFDISTNEVIEWLISMGTPFIRINIEEKNIRLISLTLTPDGTLDAVLETNGRRFKLSDLSAYWHRRGKMALDPIDRNGFEALKGAFGKKSMKEIKVNLSRERETVNTFLDHKLAGLPISIGDSSRGTLNKLFVLHKAVKAGLLISPTLVTTDKEILEEFHETHGQVITKAILDNLLTNAVDECLVFYTEEISKEKLGSLTDTFYYSLFQQRIEKHYELRIFYLKGRFYSMAIFSQGDAHTQVDFRKYNDVKPGRRIPYKLPEEIEQKLDELMKSLGLNSGSIDMIVTPTGEFLFLEVNPVGIFAMVSHPCNYSIEKDIAVYLSTGQFPN